MPIASIPEPTTPLADFFWIAGVDGSEILDTFLRLGDEYKLHGASASAGPDTIEEDAEPEETAETKKSPASIQNGERGHKKRDSYGRLSKLSTEAARLSIRSVESRGSGSNRSSITIQASNSSHRISNPRTDFDFDAALLKFSSEREIFLNDLSLSAGAITTSSRPKPRARTQKIVSEEKPASTNPLKSGIGSVRRRMSFRDMSSMKRQPSIARQGKIMVPHRS
jgi:hypothetical protein